MSAVYLTLLMRAGHAVISNALNAPRWGFSDVLFHGPCAILPRELGNRVIENIFFKIVPAEGRALSAVEAMLILRRHLLAKATDLGKDAEQINVCTHVRACLIINKSGLLHNAADRDHCMQYMLAVTFSKGDAPEYADLLDNSTWAADQRASDLRAKIKLFEDSNSSHDYIVSEKRSMASALNIKFGDGSETEEVLVEYPLGNPRNSGTAEAAETKVQKDSRLMFNHEEVLHILNAVHFRDLAVRSFMDLLWKGGEAS